MPVPAGLQGVTVTVGPLYSVTGDPIVGLPVQATLEAQVRITASGALLPSTDSTTTDETGAASLEFVASDSTGLDTTGFTYNIYVPGLTPPGGVHVVLPAASTPVQLEQLSPVSQNAGVVLWAPSDLTDAQIDAIVSDPGTATRTTLDSLYTADVLSVEGRTGHIDLSDLFDALGAAAAVDTSLSTHKTSADHDGRYYTEAEIDAMLGSVAGAAHAQTHHENGSDELDVAALGSGAAAAALIATSDGTGGVTWSPAPVTASHPQFNVGKRRREIIWDPVGNTWGTLTALPSWAYRNWWQSTNAVDATPPPTAYQLDDDWWDRHPDAPPLV